jgi:hypothetical protein
LHDVNNIRQRARIKRKPRVSDSLRTENDIFATTDDDDAASRLIQSEEQFTMMPLLLSSALREVVHTGIR